MNWKEIKKKWKMEGDERWTQHPKGHRTKKKAERRNRREGRLR